MSAKENYSLSYHEEKKNGNKNKRKILQKKLQIHCDIKEKSSLLSFGTFGWLIRIRIKF